ncbi:hydroxyisourate hydrolase [Streptomyces sp. x-80]|uniref:hydroxyisourate hydrolase n=1 Tax=Streptomyces sp. x-80 TaxID=2789282 RepID=UPI00397FB73C
MSGTTAAPASVSTHILDTSVGRPAAGVPVTLAVRSGPGGAWSAHAAATTDADGRCTDLPALPAGTTQARLVFAVEEYAAAGRPGPAERHRGGPQDGHHRIPQAEERQDAPRTGDSGAFFPEVAVTFAVRPGEHHHVPLLLNPFGYSVYRGS